MNTFIDASNMLLSKESSISEKFRALFTLRNIETDESAIKIAQAFNHKSVLLKHELAYVLGQMNRRCSISTLISVLENEDEDEIVRHEAAEALGNFKLKELAEVLEKFINHESRPIRETCELAIKKIEAELECKSNGKSIFLTLDPAYPAKISSLEEAERKYTDESYSMYERYEIMFFLRDLMSVEAVEILCKGFKDSSALFKHEVAFVLGQMQMKEATKSLANALKDENEHPMVRHECAESLGSIGTEESREILYPYLKSDIDIIRESAEVALDICYNKDETTKVLNNVSS